MIVTDYSAPHEYLDDAIAYPIPVERMAPVHDPIFYPAGGELGQWAEPDEAALRRMMRHVYSNRDEAREKGLRARERVEACWTWKHAADRARSYLACRAAGVSA